MRLSPSPTLTTHNLVAATPHTQPQVPTRTLGPTMHARSPSGEQSVNSTETELDPPPYHSINLRFPWYQSFW